MTIIKIEYFFNRGLPMSKGKKIVLLIAIMVVLIGLMMAGSSYLLKQKYYEFIEKINQTDNLKAEVIAYNLGFLSSNATMKLEFGNSTANVIFIKEKLQSGPFIFDIENPIANIKDIQLKLGRVEHFIQANNNDLLMLKMLFGEELPELKMTSVIDFNGTSNHFLNVDSKSENLKNLSAIINLNNKYDICNTYLNSDLLNVGSYEASGEIRNLSYKAHFQKDLKGRWLGNYKLLTDSFDFYTKKQKVFGIKGFETSSTVNVGANDLLLLEENLSIDKYFMYTLGEYGPLNLNLTLNNLDAQALNHLSKIQQDKHPNIFLSPTNLPSEAGLALVELLSKKPVLTVNNFILNLPQGDISFKGEIIFGSDKVTEVIVSKANYNQLVEMKAHVLVPKSIFETIMVAKVKNDIRLELINRPTTNLSTPNSPPIPVSPSTVNTQTSPVANGTQNLMVNPPLPAPAPPIINQAAPPITPENYNQELASRLKVEIDTLLSKGMITEEGMAYSSDLKYHNGKLFLNDQEYVLN
ncbi:MAG: putative rane protein YdgA-like protein [Francisellaceae bacterium]|nr:putative rane protein YdgA-like protein [Francisellaceae bacterium]